MPGECVIFCKQSGGIKVFASNQLLDRVRKEGVSRTSQITLGVINNLTIDIARASEKLLRYSSRGILEKEDVENMFEILGTLCKGYEYFDPYYWDYAFETAKSNPDMARTIELINDSKNKFRALMDPIFFGSNSYFHVITHALSKQFHISQETLIWYCAHELIELFNGRPITDSEIDARKIGYFLHKVVDMNVELFSGNEAVSYIQEFEKTLQVDVSVPIIGKVAYGKGAIRGRVRIVRRNYSDPEVLRVFMKAMQSGDVLVSETTDPELVEVMKKAGAIVTDVGGLLSHAAITSRELKIPCVVDTKVATRILKDGDVVEVDADKGIITILYETK